jgi:hypothetical protein
MIRPNRESRLLGPPCCVGNYTKPTLQHPRLQLGPVRGKQYLLLRIRYYRRDCLAQFLKRGIMFYVEKLVGSSPDLTLSLLTSFLDM